MKKFQFPMEKILSYKGQILDSEMMNLAVLRDLLGNVQKRLEGLEQERLKTKQEFETKVSIEIETKSLETIKESKFEEYKKEDLKRTEQFVDEFISGSRVMSKVFRESI